MQHIGGIRTQRIDVGQVSAALAGFFRRGQGQAVLAVAGLIGSTRAFKPVGHMLLEGFKGVQIGLRGGDKIAGGIGDVPVNLVQRLPTDAGRQFKQANTLQLPVKEGSAGGVEYIAVELILLKADFFNAVGPADLSGPVSAQ